MQRGRNCWQTGSVNQTGLLVDGCDYYRAFYRAAQAAERYILISGWQFDSGTALLRGAEAEQAQGKIDLLEFLNELCERKSDAAHIHARLGLQHVIQSRP